MDDGPVKEYRNKMIDWGLPLSQYSQQCQVCFAPQSGSGLDIVENTEQVQIAAYYGRFCGAKRPQCEAERPGFLLI